MGTDKPLCILCGSRENRKIFAIDETALYKCQRCKLIFKWPLPQKDIIYKQVESYYAEVDPHRSVAIAKNRFFKKLLDYFTAEIKRRERSLLDVGCGYGYLMQLAAKRGWKTYGVEIMENGYKYITKQLNLPVFKGDLTEAPFTAASFDVVTIIDVLSKCSDPFLTLKTVYHVLKKGGLVAIRLRNYYFHYMMHLIYRIGKRLFFILGIINPSVFDLYSFTPFTIKRMLCKAGFKEVKAKNSYLTIGDPYIIMKGSILAKIIKTIIYYSSQMIYYLSFGRVVMGPSILVTAKKINEQKD